MFTAWRAIFGTYTLMTDYNGDPISGPAGINFEYILVCIFFILVFHWFCKFLFSLFK